MNRIHQFLRVCGIACCLTGAAHATDGADDAAGLLGQRQVRVTGAGFHMEGVSPLDDYAVGWAVDANFPVAPQWDAGIGYESNRDGSLIGLTMAQRTIQGAVTWHGQGSEWRPFVRAALGSRSWVVDGWTSSRRRSMTYAGSAGVEFQMARRFVLTPAIEYFNSPDLDDDAGWTAGVTAEWRCLRRWSVLAMLRRIEWVDDTAATVWGGGLALHF